jgi:prevent-host-death family protein
MIMSMCMPAAQKTAASRQPPTWKPASFWLNRHLTAHIDQTRLGHMKMVNIQAAKTHLSRLVEEAAKGEEIVLAKAGKPIARLVAYRGTGKKRKFGAWKGKVQMGDDFNEESPELNRLFEGKD